MKRVECGLVEPVIHGELSVEPLECIEIPPLVGVIKRLAEIEVSNFVARGRTGGESQGQTESNESANRSHRLPFPKHDRSAAGTRSGQGQSDQLWLHFLAESKLSRAAEVRAALKLAVDQHVQLVISGRRCRRRSFAPRPCGEPGALWRCRCNAQRVARRSGAAQRRGASCRPWPARRRSRPVSLTDTAVSPPAGSAPPTCGGHLT